MISVGIDASPILGTRSGVGNYSYQLMQALLSLENTPHLTFYAKQPVSATERAFFLHPQVRWRSGHFARSHWVWMQGMLPWLIHRDQPDLCHFTNALAPLGMTRPYVVTIHDASLFFFRHYHPWPRLCSHLILPLVVARAQKVITVSHHARAELQRALPQAAAKTEVVYEAPAPHFAPVTDEALLAKVKQQYQLPPKYLLYVGTIEPRKNLMRLVRAFARVHATHPDYQLLLAGGMGWMMSGLLTLIEELGLQEVVRWVGYVPDELLPALYSRCDLFLFPSLYEGFGLPPLEAMACGAPVLSSNGSALVEVLGAAAVLVDPLDEGALAAGIADILQNSSLRQELGQRGLARAAQFSWQTAARETAVIYQQLLGEKRG